jgi:hypothetical protein
MRTIILSIYAVAALLVAAPYLVGLENERNVIIACQNFTERTDSDIEDVLRVYNFDTDCLSTPTLADYYKSGFKTLFN